MLERIKLENFKCFYGEHAVELPEGIINIRGKTDGNEGRSNRSGKSSFMEAILFAIFRQNAAKFVSSGESELSVELMLNGNSFQHVNASSYVNGEKVLIAAAKAASETMIGMSEDLFLCTVGAFSGNVQGLLALKPKDQKDLLLNSFSSSHYNWEEMYDLLKEELDDLLKKRNNILSKIEFYEEKLADISYDHYVSKEDRIRIQKETLEYEIESKKTTDSKYMEDFIKLTSDIANLERDIKESVNSMQQVEQYEELLSQVVEAKLGLSAEMKKYLTLPGYDKRIKKYGNLAYELKSKFTDLEEKILSYQCSGGKCPILHEDCPYNDRLKEESLEWESQILAVTKALNDAEDKLEDSEADRRALSQFTSLYKDKVNKEEELKRNIMELYRKERPLVDMQEELVEMRAKRVHLETIISPETTKKLMNELMTAEKNLQAVRDVLNNYNEMSKLKEEFNKKLYEMDTSFKNYYAAVKLVSPRGIPYLLLSSVIEELQAYTNKYLELAGMKVYISGYTELKSKEDYCSSDGYKYRRDDTACAVCGIARENKIVEEMRVISADRLIPFEEESSGGKALISLGVRFGLLEMAKRRKATVDFMFLDEVFTNLDFNGKMLALKMIEFAKDELEIKQVFMVTHDELKDLVPTTFIIHNVNGKSSIE